MSFKDNKAMIMKLGMIIGPDENFQKSPILAMTSSNVKWSNLDNVKNGK